MKLSKLFLKALIALSLLFGVIALITSVYAGWNLSQNLTGEFKSKGTAISRAISNSAVEVILNSNESTLQSIVDQFLDIRGVAYVFVTDRSQAIISHTFVPQIPQEIHELLAGPDAVREDSITHSDLTVSRIGHVKNIAAPVLAGEVGYVHVGMDMAVIRFQIWRSILIQQALILLILIVAFYLAYRMIAKISAPLNTLTAYANKLAAHDFSSPLQDKSAIDALSQGSTDEIGKLATAFGVMEERIIDYIQNLKETTAVKERIESELKIGRDIQMNIIPQTFPAFPNRKEFDVFAYIEPAKEVGGDFYDFFVDEVRHKFVFLVGDVSGKGVPAALFMAVTMTMLRATASESTDPAAVLQTVNKALCQNNDAALFVTLFYGVLDYHTGEFKYCLAGHNPPYLLEDGQSPALLASTRSMALGVDDSAMYQSNTLTLKPGARLVAFTDGVTEAMDPQDNLYTDDRLTQLLTKSAHRSPKTLISTIVDDVLDFANGAPQADDITLLSIEYFGNRPKML